MAVNECVESIGERSSRAIKMCMTTRRAPTIATHFSLSFFTQVHSGACLYLCFLVLKEIVWFFSNELSSKAKGIAAVSDREMTFDD